MGEHLSSDDKPSPRTGMEDWCGSETDKAQALTIRRVWNGIIVDSQSQHGSLVFQGQMLVFQDITKFIDWVQEWYDKTSFGAHR